MKDKKKKKHKKGSKMQIKKGQASSYTVYTVAFLIFLHFVILYLMLSGTLKPLFNDATHRIGGASDFYVYYLAGKFFLAGEGAYGHGPGFGFRYHPAFAATICAALSLFPANVAYFIWVSILEISYFGLWLLLFKLLKSQRQFILASIILTFFSPYYLEIFMGNNSFLVAVLLLCAFLLYERKYFKSFGALLALSLIIKPIGLIFLPLLLMQKKFLLAVMVVLIIVASALPFFLLDYDSFQKFTKINLEAIPAKGWVLHAGNQGFHAFVTNIVTRFAGIPTSELSSFNDLPRMGAFLLNGLPFIFIILTALATWLNRTNLGLCLFLWSATYLLGYKDIWEHTYSFSILGLIWLFLSGLLSKRFVLIVAVWIALPTAFFLYDVPLPPGPNDPEHHWSFAISILHHGTKSIVLLMLYLAVIFKVFQNWKAQRG